MSNLEQAGLGGKLANCGVGDTFTFGNYPQGANGEVQPVEWQVLRRDNDGVLVISKYALDCKPYNEGNGHTTWSECTLRKWLNNEFINQAFNDDERKLIQDVHITNAVSFYKDVPGGPDTDDRIFLLSYSEAHDWCGNWKPDVDNWHCEVRTCQATAYAKKNNAQTEDGACWWWLRSLGSNTYAAACVDAIGGFSDGIVGYDKYAVRPVLKIAF